MQAQETLETFKQHSGLNIGDVPLTSEVVSNLDWRDSVHILGVTFFKEWTMEQDYLHNLPLASKK